MKTDQMSKSKFKCYIFKVLECILNKPLNTLGSGFGFEGRQARVRDKSFRFSQSEIASLLNLRIS